MHISELQRRLNESHASFIRTIQSVTDADFTKSVNDKWTAGQQLKHIIMSVTPVNQAFSLPPFMLRLLFGKANRISGTYDQLVKKYQSKLKTGGRAPGRFSPPSVTPHQRKALTKKLEKLTVNLNKRLTGFSERQLDQMILPHPLLGKLTLREMIYFTIYHAGHHERQVIDNLTTS